MTEDRKRLPFVPFYPGDFFGSVRVQSLRGPEKWLYAYLLDLEAAAGGDGLPADEEELRKLCDCSRRTFDKFSTRIRQEFFIRKGDRLFNSRMEEVISEVRRKSFGHAEGARKTNETRWRNRVAKRSLSDKPSGRSSGRLAVASSDADADADEEKKKQAKRKSPPAPSGGAVFSDSPSAPKRGEKPETRTGDLSGAVPENSRPYPRPEGPEPDIEKSTRELVEHWREFVNPSEPVSSAAPILRARLMDEWSAKQLALAMNRKSLEIQAEGNSKVTYKIHNFFGQAGGWKETLHRDWSEPTKKKES